MDFLLRRRLSFIESLFFVEWLKGKNKFKKWKLGRVTLLGLQFYL